MCFILKIARTRRIRNWPSFFLNTVQFARTFCFTWLTWFTPRGIHTIGGQTCHWSFWVRLCSLQNEQFQQNGQFHHSNVKLLVLISNLPFHSDWLRLWCLWQMSGFIRGYHQKKLQWVPTFFISLTELLFDHFVGSEYWRMLEPISFMTLKYSHICGTQYST